MTEVTGANYIEYSENVDNNTETFATFPIDSNLILDNTPPIELNAEIFDINNVTFDAIRTTNSIFDITPPY